MGTIIDAMGCDMSHDQGPSCVDLSSAQLGKIHQCHHVFPSITCPNPSFFTYDPHWASCWKHLVTQICPESFVDLHDFLYLRQGSTGKIAAEDSRHSRHSHRKRGRWIGGKNSRHWKPLTTLSPCAWEVNWVIFHLAFAYLSLSRKLPCFHSPLSTGRPQGPDTSA